MFNFVGELISPNFFGDWSTTVKAAFRPDNPDFEILSYYDGPLTFSFVKERVLSSQVTEVQRYLAHALEVEGDTIRYLVSPIGEWAYFQLKENMLPILDSLAANVSYVVDENSKVNIWKTTINEMPPDCLPHPGVTLYANKPID